MLPGESREIGCHLLHGELTLGGALVPATEKVAALSAPAAVYSAAPDDTFRITVRNDGEHPLEFDKGDELFEAQLLEPGDLTVPSEATAAMVSSLSHDERVLLASFTSMMPSSGDESDAATPTAGRPGMGVENV